MHIYFQDNLSTLHSKLINSVLLFLKLVGIFKLSFTPEIDFSRNIDIINNSK